MKYLLSGLMFLSIFVSCSKKEEVSIPVLDFNISYSERYAPAQINITNSSTGYSGTYKWEVSYVSGLFKDTYSSKDLSLNVEKVGNHVFKLSTIDGKYSVQKELNILKPSYLVIKKVTLTDVSKSYDEVYFKIRYIDLMLNQVVVYTSPKKYNVTPLSTLGGVTWNVEFPYGNLSLVDFSGELRVHIIEFYDKNNNLFSKMDGVGNMFDEYSTYKNEVKTVQTSNCPSCDYTEAELTLEFSNN